MTHSNKALLAQNIQSPNQSRSEHYRHMFGLSNEPFIRRLLSWRLLDQLDACKDDEARRLLLGLGRPQ